MSVSQTPPDFIAVDFFCGAGGTTRGFINAGGYVCAGIDFDKNCELTYTTNNPNIRGDKSRPEFFAMDLLPATDEHPSGQQSEVKRYLRQLLERAKMRWADKPVVFSICAPCQPFTRLTQIEMKKGTKERRRLNANLLLESVKFVEWFRPDVIFTENVSGVRSRAYGTVWLDYENELSRLGYMHQTETVCTSDFGIPQYRKRVIMMAVKKSILSNDVLERGDLGLPLSDPFSVKLSVREAIGHLPPVAAGSAHALIPNHRARALSALNTKRLSSSVPGASNRDLQNTSYGNLLAECHMGMDERSTGKGFTNVYTRMHPDQPSPTITTKCVSISNGRFGHFDTSQLRAITPREAAILQSFPEDYIFYPTDKLDAPAKMIGNAVPPKLAEFYARYSLSLLRKQNA